MYSRSFRLGDVTDQSRRWRIGAVVNPVHRVFIFGEYAVALRSEGCFTRWLAFNPFTIICTPSFAAPYDPMIREFSSWIDAEAACERVSSDTYVSAGD